jgi:acetylornithine deacetylase/succinyl-diaminopimelate desuccinylase-like protein
MPCSCIVGLALKSRRAVPAQRHDREVCILMSAQTENSFIDTIWDTEIVPVLCDYIRIPNKSPAFDPDWLAHGHMERVVTLFAEWAQSRIGAFAGARLEVVRLEGRTPLIFIEIPGDAPGTVLLYGHLDKQPEMKGWSEGTGPWEPVLRDGKLYGRGGADDGYALFASVAALLAVRRDGFRHARCVIIIEAGEESGSPDLPYYIDHLSHRIGQPDLVVCLDSGAGNYEQLWLTTSLRGIIVGNLTVQVLEEGVHSGSASGIVPSSLRVLRSLLSRIEDESTGRIRVAELYADIPEERQTQARQAAAILGDRVWSEMPWSGRTRPTAADDGAALIIAKTWEPQLAVTAIEGYPSVKDGGNVLLPFTTAKLSIRLPPTVNAATAAQALKRVLELNPPYGATIKFDVMGAEGGWNAPASAPWLRDSLNRASSTQFERPAAYQGEGGSIPFMAMLGKKFPATQFVVTGVLGPHSNAHGPNEFLHIEYAKKITGCIAQVVKDHANRPASAAS